jgi:hypothetical protein
MLFDNLEREKVSEREGYLCLFLSRLSKFSCIRKGLWLMTAHPSPQKPVTLRFEDLSDQKVSCLRTENCTSIFALSSVAMAAELPCSSCNFRAAYIFFWACLSANCPSTVSCTQYRHSRAFDSPRFGHSPDPVNSDILRIQANPSL